MKKRCDLVNCLKGVAIILVILVHSTQYFNVPEWLKLILNPSQIGSQIFFVMSAYTLCLSYSKSKPSYLKFIKRRVSRIAVGYWTMLLVYTFLRVVKAFIGGGNVFTAINIRGFVVNFLFLNGLSTSIETTNYIVRGGWFVGTIFLLYLSFPLLFKMYEKGNEKWEKIRPVAFPIIILAATNIIMACLCLADEKFVCQNNSIMYFSFFNQISSFSIGFVIYDIHKKQLFGHIKYSLLKSIISFGVALFLFYAEYRYSFSLFPFFVGLSIMYIFCFFKNRQGKETDGRLTKLLYIFGQNSFAIYLTHFFVVWDCTRIAIKLVGGSIKNDIIFYIITLPIMYAVSLVIGKIFTKYITKMERVLRLR